MNRLDRVVWHASLALIVSGTFSFSAEAQTIGGTMVSFLNGQVNNRVGGGESAHMAIEALRVAGGEFCPSDLGADSPGSGDTVWGTLVTTISVSNGNWSDSNPGNPCLPGDVIQWGGQATVGNMSYPVHFTTVVQAVGGGSGRPSSIFQQNFNQVRTVQVAQIDLTQLSTGWACIYRPVARVDEPTTWKFTVVNNAPTSQTFTVMYGITTVSTITATAANTSGSFFVFQVTTDGSVPCVVNNDNTIYVEIAKGNEIFNSSDFGLGIDQLSQ